MLVTVALVFAALTPFVVGTLFALALCQAAKLGDEQQADPLECKYAAPACEGSSRVRSGR
jgi:hypothetical protein